MVIKRQRYLDKLISHMNNGLIKVITGIRRCGKSYLLFEIFYKYLLEQGVPKENIITVPLDDEEYAELIDAHNLSDYIKSRLVDSNQNYYVFIDEAQYAITKEEMKNPDVPIRLYGVLNGLLRKKNVDVYVTGSNSKFLSSDIKVTFTEIYIGLGKDIHNYGLLIFIIGVSEGFSIFGILIAMNLHKIIEDKKDKEKGIVISKNNINNNTEKDDSKIEKKNNDQQSNDSNMKLILNDNKKMF